MFSRCVETDPHPINKLRNLKEEIRTASQRGICKLVENYKNADELATLLFNDLKNAIEQDFPLMDLYPLTIYKQRILTYCRKDESQLRKEEHVNYAHQRCVLYIPNPAYFTILDEWTSPSQTKNQGSFLWIVGESGSGKSSLISNWWLHRIEEKSEELTTTFVHFVGASTYASEFSGMIYALFRDINSLLGKSGEIPIPKDESQLVSSIPKFLSAMSQRV